MGESTSNISRRTLTKGIAWAVPAIALATAAPAFATSNTVSTAFICKISEQNATINYQSLNIYLDFTTNDGSPLKTGTKFTWTITVESGTGTLPRQPSLTYGPVNLTILNATTTGTTLTFTLVAEVVADFIPSGSCSAAMIWTNSVYPLPVNSTVTMAATSATTGSSADGTATLGGLKFNVGSRYRVSVNNNSTLRPFRFLGLLGDQKCYPLVDFNRLITNSNTDAQVCYPNNTCVYGAPASGSGQMIVASVC